MSEKNSFTLADWAHAKIEPFDLTEVFEKDIEPLVTQLAEKLNSVGMPFSMLFAMSYDASGTGITHRASLCGPEKCPSVILFADLMAEGNFSLVSFSIHLAALKVRTERNSALDEEVSNVTH